MTYKPTTAMASAAKRGIEMRDRQPDSNKCCTSVGLKRASQLAKGESLSLDTVKRMYSFFSRHEVDKKSDSWKKGDSKGEQAWLMWGGDAGYSWSRKIVESERKSNMQITINSTVKPSQITDSLSGEFWLINGVPVTVDGAVMNGLLYSAEHNKDGMPSLTDRKATAGHPLLNGAPADANTPEMEVNYWLGGHVQETYKDGDIWRVNLKIKKELAKVQNKELYDRINARKDIGVSTGLMTKVIKANGESNGKRYTGIATKQEYNHLALLPANEPPAGGEDTFIRFNGEDCETDSMIINLDELLSEDKEQEKESLINRIITAVTEKLANVNNNDDNNSESVITNGDITMTKDQKTAALKKCGKYKENMSDEEINAAYEEMNTTRNPRQPRSEDNGNEPKSNSDMQAQFEAMQAQINALQAQVNAQADAEKIELGNKLGMSEAEAKALEINTLQSLVAKTGGTMGLGSAPAVNSGEFNNEDFA